MSKNLSPRWWLTLIMSLFILLSPLSLKPACSDDQAQVLPLPQERCSMRFVDAEVRDVLRLLAKEYKLNLIVSEDVGGVITVDFDQVFLEDIFFSVLKTAGLGYVQRGEVILIGTQKELLEQETARIKELEKQAEANKKILEAQGMVSEMIRVKYILNTKATESIAKELAVEKEAVRNLTQMAESLKKMLSERKGASVEVVDAANALVVTDIPEKVAQIKKLVQELDQPSPQIMIEAKIVMMEDTYFRDLGVQWGGKVASGDLTITGQRNRTYTKTTTETTGIPPSTTETTADIPTGNNYGIDFPALITAGQGASVGLLLGKLTKDYLDARLTALQDDGKAKILASPRVVTQDNQKAYIKVGDEIPYQEYTVVGGAITTELKFKDAAIELEVSPHTVDENVFMDIVVARKLPDFAHLVAGYPPLRAQALTTKISVKSGETFALGGLTTEEDTTQVHGVPFLSRIRFLGVFFKNESKGKTKRELIVFITPTIIGGDAQGDTDAQRIPGGD